MKVFSVLVCFALFFIKAFADGKSENEEKKIVCYFTGWSKGRPGDASYTVDQVDPFLCTHIIYAFFTIDVKNRVIAPNSLDELDVIKQLTSLKEFNPNLKILVNTGGWLEGSERYSEIASELPLRQDFAKNTVKFLRDYQLDGFEFGWLYPGTRDKGRPDDKEKYVLLIQETRQAIETEAAESGNPPVLLSVSFKPLANYLNGSISVPEINMYVDIMNTITYDFHSVYSGVIGHPSPLYPTKNDSLENPLKPIINTAVTITNLLEAGADPGKITLGIPTYGRYFLLENEKETDFGSVSLGPAPSRTVDEKGIKNYYEICQDNPKWTVKRVNATAVGPYAYKFDTWVAYDDEVIIREKAKFALMQNLGGLNFWTIDDDDFLGTCNTGKYPLITSGKLALEAVKSSTDAPSTTTTTRKSFPSTFSVPQLPTTAPSMRTTPQTNKAPNSGLVISKTPPSTRAPVESLTQYSDGKKPSRQLQQLHFHNNTFFINLDFIIN